mgnify:CR=1 FL=1
MYTFRMWVSKRFLLIGIAFSLPFVIANALVAMREEFFLSLLRPAGEMTNYEQVLVLTLIALVGAGGLVALLPIVKERRVYVVNALLGAVFIALAVFLGYELGKDFYHCEVLKIPNCD